MMFESIDAILSAVNNSKLTMGLLMILLNIGSKYVDLGFSKTQEQLLKTGISREILIFAISFTATRDIMVSLIITAAFFVLAEIIFHEESKYCIMPDHMKRVMSIIDTNQDGIISAKEEEKAIQLLKKAEKQRNKQIQGSFISHLATTSTFI